MFADEYIIDCNGTRAYKVAYPHVKSDASAATCAGRLLRIVEVKEYIEKRLAAAEASRIADGDEVLRYLSDVMRGEVKEDVVVVENIGDFMSEARVLQKHVCARDRTKAAELLGKRHRLFTDVVEHKDTGMLEKLIAGVEDDDAK